MKLRAAPFYSEIAYGPDSGAAHWIDATDGCQIRFGHWPLAEATGTVLIFPGRTEFIEKYGQVAQNFAARGFASAAIDWRGQGLADRLLENRLIGYVEQFSDYQKDVFAMVAAAQSLALPRPYFLLGHSMGGAIGLRALLNGIPVSAAAFSGPMWGIRIAPRLKPAAWILSRGMPRLGLGHHLPPGTKLDHHVLTDPFEGNLLTRDRRQFEIMGEQMRAYPDMALGGPSYVWLREALAETSALARRKSPDLPCITFLGSNERIVDIPPIQARMERWPGGTLEIVENGEHEVLMESSDVTEPLFDKMAEVFSKTASR
ncbi:MAG: alpha/beta hydrolase [Pseudomonadota bacterium]